VVSVTGTMNYPLPNKLSESEIIRNLQRDDGFTKEQAEEVIHEGYMLLFGMAVGQVLFHPATRN